MPERAEIEAAAEAIRDTYVALGTRSGLFGSVGLLDERSRIRIAEVILDRVRDARGDGEAPPYPGPRRWITCPECGSTDEASDTPCTNLGCPSHDRRGNIEALRERAEMDGTAARSPQGEDHGPAEDGIEDWPKEPLGPQGEDHEAKLEAIGAYLEQYPPAGFTDRYSASGWSHIARGVLSAAAVFAADGPQGEDHEGGNQNDERRH